MFPVSDSVPRRMPALLVWSLIGINTFVFMVQVSLPPPASQWLVWHWALIPVRYTDPAWALLNGLDPHDWLPFLTNTFMHGGWFHLIGNMWTLWLFGGAVEDRLGVARFLVLYLVCGVVASYVHFALNPTSPLPALGASGAIAGVIGAYAVMFPLARIVIMVPVLFFPLFFDVYAIAFAMMWFVLQFMQGAQGLLVPEQGGGVAWWAHVGGFVCGVVLLQFLRPRRSRRRAYYGDESRLAFGPRGERG